MANEFENLSAGWRGAVVAIDQGGIVSLRPAAFVFDVPGGVAWVEPSYADPAGAASPAFHAFKGTVGGNTVTAPGGMLIEVLPYESADAGVIGDGLEWFASWLAAEGRTWEQERARVREMLGEALA